MLEERLGVFLVCTWLVCCVLDIMGTVGLRYWEHGLR